MKPYLLVAIPGLRAPRTMTILLDLPPPWRDARFQC